MPVSGIVRESGADQNDAMPRLVRPPQMPQEVAEAIDIIGNRARTEILHALLVQGPLTTTELAEHLGTTRSSTHRQMLALERAGVAVADLDQPVRQGRTVRWSLNRQKVRQAADAWSAYAAGE